MTLRTRLTSAISGLLVFALASSACTPCFAQEIVDSWRYTIRKPADGWQQADYNDAEWKEASGGFGTRGTPGSRIGTTWATNNIWLRKSLKLESVPTNPAAVDAPR